MSSPSQRRGGCGHMMAGFDPTQFVHAVVIKRKGRILV